MRICILLMSILLIQTVSAEAGWMDKLKSRVKGVVDHSINDAEKEVESAVNKKIKRTSKDTSKQKTPTVEPSNPSESSEPVKQSQQPTPTGTWAIDVVLKGVRLGMPEDLAVAALKKEGFERQTDGIYVQQMVDFGNEVKKIRPSELSKLPVDKRGTVQRGYAIKLSTAIATEECLSELKEPLKGMIVKAKKNNPKKLRLVDGIEYTQYFFEGSQWDHDALKQQVLDRYGPETYTVKYSRSGAAFSYGELWYHDADLISEQEKQAIINDAVKREQGVLKKSFKHPCGAGKCGGAATNVYVAFPDNLSRGLEAAKIMYAPHMSVALPGFKVIIKLEWMYLGAEKVIRDEYTTRTHYKTLPKAQMDF